MNATKETVLLCAHNWGILHLYNSIKITDSILLYKKFNMSKEILLQEIHYFCYGKCGGKVHAYYL